MPAVKSHNHWDRRQIVKERMCVGHSKHGTSNPLVPICGFSNIEIISILRLTPLNFLYVYIRGRSVLDIWWLLSSKPYIYIQLHYAFTDTKAWVYFVCFAGFLLIRQRGAIICRATDRWRLTYRPRPSNFTTKAGSNQKISCPTEKRYMNQASCRPILIHLSYTHQ